MKHGVKERRKGALERLESQLIAGTKPVRKSSDKTVKLNEGDISRINKEIQILKNKN